MFDISLFIENDRMKNNGSNPLKCLTMKQRNLSLPSAAVINAIEIASDSADWNCICKYIGSSATFMAIKWGIRDDFKIDEIISMSYEKAFRFRHTYDSEKGNRRIVADMMLADKGNKDMAESTGKDAGPLNILKCRVKADMCRYLESNGFDVNELCSVSGELGKAS